MEAQAPVGQARVAAAEMAASEAIATGVVDRNHVESVLPAFSRGLRLGFMSTG